MKKLSTKIDESLKNSLNENSDEIGFDEEDEIWDIKEWFPAKDYKKHIPDDEGDFDFYTKDKDFQAFIKKNIKNKNEMVLAIKADGMGDSAGIFQTISYTDKWDKKYSEFQLMLEDD